MEISRIRCQQQTLKEDRTRNFNHPLPEHRSKDSYDLDTSAKRKEAADQTWRYVDFINLINMNNEVQPAQNKNKLNLNLQEVTRSYLKVSLNFGI